MPAWLSCDAESFAASSQHLVNWACAVQFKAGEHDASPRSRPEESVSQAGSRLKHGATGGDGNRVNGTTRDFTATVRIDTPEAWARSATEAYYRKGETSLSKRTLEKTPTLAPVHSNSQYTRGRRKGARFACIEGV